MRKLSQSGSSHIAAIAAIVIIAVVAIAGYRVMQHKSTTSPVVSSSNVTLPSKITSKADLQQTGKALDAAPINDSLNPNQLDAAIKSIL